MQKNVADIFAYALKEKSNPKIKLLGDSITHGVGGTGWTQNGALIVKGWAESPDGYSWANLLRDYMKEKYNVAVVNKACTATNIEFVMNHFSELVDEDDDLIICAIGTNNRHQYFESGEKYDKEIFLKELYDKMKAMYGMFENTKIPTIFVANIPASKKNEQDGENYWRILHMSDINDSYKKLARECNANVLSLYDLFLDYCSENNCCVDDFLLDGLHPNDKGQKLIFDLLVKVFDGKTQKEKTIREDEYELK